MKISELPRFFDQIGLGISLNLFGNARISLNDLKNSFPIFTPDLKIIIESFILREYIDLDKLSSVISKECVDELLSYGLFKIKHNKAQSRYFLRYFNTMYFFQNPSQGLGYFDSIDSFMALRPNALICDASKILVLFSFYGIECLHPVLGHKKKSNVCIHVHPSGLNIANINCTLNSINAYVFTNLHDIEEKKFDLILSAPPYLPKIDLPIKKLVFAGKKGSLYIDKFLKIVYKLLSDEGTAFLLGALLGKEMTIERDFYRKLELKNFDYKFFKTSLQAMSPGVSSKILNNLIWYYMSSIGNTSNGIESSNNVVADLLKNKIDSALLFSLLITRSKEVHSNRSVLDFSNKYYGTWLL